MVKNPIVMELRGYLSKLEARRQELMDELQEIDEAISELGVSPAAPSRRGRKPKVLSAAQPAGKRGRKPGRKGQMELTAEEFITKIVVEAGQLTTKQINDAWKKCRGGVAGNTLTNMSKNGKLVKEDNLDGRGSLYKLPAGTSA